MDNKQYNFEDIEKQDEILTEQKDYSFIANTNVTYYKTDLAFKTLMDSFDNLLCIVPKYQRKEVWSKEQVGNLAISLIRGLPIPPIYGYRNEKNKLVILDGQQRILSLFLYYKGKYIKNTESTEIEFQRLMDDYIVNKSELTFQQLLEDEYLLEDITYDMKYKEDYEEKTVDITYNRLSKAVQKRIDFTPITVIEVAVDSACDKNRMLYKIFENLNIGKREVTNQEARNVAYQCSFYDMLHETNDTNKKWRKIYGKKHSHSKDVELLLRFAALQYYYELEDGTIELKNYEDSYPNLLNDFSNEAVNLTTSSVYKYRKDIDTFIGKIAIEERLPNILLESLYLASLCVQGEYKITEEIVESIVNDELYKEYILSSSSSKSKVEGRLNYVYEKLSKYVDENKK